MPRIIITVIAIIIGVLVAIFTVDSREVVNYNDAVIKLSNDIDARFQPFLNLVGNYADGSPVNAQAVKQALADGKSQGTPLIENLKSFSVPDDELCRNFHTTLVNFAEMYTKHDGAFNEIVTYIEAHNSPSDEDTAHVSDLMAPFALEYDVNGMAIQSSQKTMADKYKIELQY